MGRAILAHANGIVGPDVGDGLFHERSEPHTGAHVVAEDQEGGAIDTQPAMEAHAIENGAHGVFPDAPVEIPARGARSEFTAILDVRIVGRSQVRASTDEIGYLRGDGVQGLTAGFAGGLFVRESEGWDGPFPIPAQLAAHEGLELGREFGMGGTIGFEMGLPLGFHFLSAPFGGTPMIQGFGGHFEGSLGVPSQDAFGGLDLIHTERCAVGVMSVLLRGCREADDGAAIDERGLAAGFHRLLEGRGQGAQVLAVLHLEHAPTHGLEALGHVFAEGEIRVALDGDPVVVPEHDQFLEPQMARQARRFVSDPLHQATVAREGEGAMIDHIEAGTVEAVRQPALGDGHAHGVPDALPQWPRGGLHTIRVPELGVSRCLRIPLPEVLQIIQAQPVAREMQQGVNEHRGMAAGKNEPVPVRPLRVVRVVSQELRPQHIGSRSLGHGRAGVPAVGLLDGVHGKAADGVDAEFVELGGGKGHGILKSKKGTTETRSARSKKWKGIQ